MNMMGRSEHFYIAIALVSVEQVTCNSLQYLSFITKASQKLRRHTFEAGSHSVIPNPLRVVAIAHNPSFWELRWQHVFVAQPIPF